MFNGNEPAQQRLARASASASECPSEFLRMQSIDNSDRAEPKGSIRIKAQGAANTRARRSPTVRQQLRHATAAIHQSLHDHPGFVRLVEGRMTLSDYRDLLARLHGFHWPLERGLRAAPPDTLCGFNVRQRERSWALRADLRVLGLTGADIDSLPVCDCLRPVGSNAELVGRLYVVEGAGLGGRALAAKLEGLLGDGGSEGRLFFAGRAAPDPLPWPSFCRWLEAQGGRADIDVVIESAETTFHALADWLREGERNV
jgi:heme oxygenase